MVVAMIFDDPKKIVADPTQLGEELRKKARASEPAKVRRLLLALPNWSIRDVLIDTADELAMLKRGVRLGRAAKSLNHRIDWVAERVGECEEVVWQIAIKMAALGAHNSGLQLHALPEEARRRIRRDNDMLISIRDEAYQLRDALTVLIASSDGSIDTIAVERKLRVVADTLRQLSAQERTRSGSDTFAKQ
jgi:hypothetical protein